MSCFDHNSKVAGHVHHLNDNMHFENAKVVGLEANYHERLFLEAWHSTVDPNTGNDQSRTSKTQKYTNVLRDSKSNAYGHARKPSATFFFK